MFVQAPTAGVVPMVHAVVGGQPVSPGVVFVGRHDETERLLAALAPGDAASPVVVSAVAGMGGVGKTALARFCAAEAVKRDWFPGGAYVVDLQGYSPGGMVSGHSVFAPLLHQFGVPAKEVPGEPAAQAAVYDQTLRVLARQGQRVLLVLDNASTADQVKGLLPTTGDHRAVVTTRDTLAIPGARRLDLNVLTEVDAVALLDKALREHDPDDDRASYGAAVLVGVCGLLPLAVRIAAGLLADEPDTSCAELATELASTSTDAFTHGETKVAPVLTASIDVLAVRDPGAAQLLRLLPLNPGPDISTEAAAALGGVSVDVARTSLRALRQAHLINLVDRRWRMHDLVRRHLLDHMKDSDAFVRLLDFYMMTARAADAHLRALPGQSVPEDFTGRDQALSWFDAERANLVASVTSAKAANQFVHTMHLAFTIATYQLTWRRDFTEYLFVNQVALDACIKSGKRLGEGIAWNNMGRALREMNQHDEAVTAYEHALEIFREADEPARESLALSHLGVALGMLGKLDEALATHRHVLASHQETGDRHAEGIAWGNLASALRDMQRLDEAATAFGHARDMFQEIGDRHREGWTWNELGLVLRQQLEFDKAVTAFEHARDILQEVGDRHYEGVAWSNLALALTDLHRVDEALHCLREAAAAYSDSGDTDNAEAHQQLLEKIEALKKTTGS